MRLTRTVFIVAALVVCINASLYAQQTVTGTPPFGSFGGGAFDTINLGNLNLHFAIPILHKAGRGVPFNYDLVYEGSVWTPVTSGSTTVWQPVNGWGWISNYAGTTGYISNVSSGYYCYDSFGHPIGHVQTISNWAYKDAWGVSHPFFGQIVTSTCPGVSSVSSFSSTANDNSGLTMNIGTSLPQIQTKEGLGINPVAAPTGPYSTTKTDSNGNQVSSDATGAFTDTLGTTALTVAGSGTATSPVTFTYTDPTTSTSHYTLNYTNKAVKTNFGCSGVGEYTNASVALPTSLTLPDGVTSYSFTYEATPGNSGYVTGRIASVTLPTGGTISYDYHLGTNNGIVCADGSASRIDRTTPDSSTPWKYIRTAGTGSAWTTTVTSPLIDVATIQFAKYVNPYNNLTYYFETQRTVRDSTSTLLETVITCYNSTPSTCAGTPSLPITQYSVTTQLPDATGRQSEIYEKYLGNGAVQERDEYDSSLGAVGALLRRTVINYGSYNGSTCVPLTGIGGLPCQSLVYDGAGVLVAKTNYSYDETSVTPTTGTPQHISVTTARGNMTTSSRWTSGTSSLVSTFSYFDTGNVNVATEPNGAASTYTYNGCTNSFPSNISLPLSLSRQATWNCSGGVLASSTDENGQVTSFGYTDPHYWRNTSVGSPDGGVATTTYSTSPWSVSVTSKIDTTRNLTTATLLDSLGRTKQQQTTSDPVATVSVDTTYDAVGRIHTVSNPYRSTSDPTYGLTTFTYDALDRRTKITNPDSTYKVATFSKGAVQIQDEGRDASGNRTTRVVQADGLGRTSAVCEVASVQQQGANGTPAACNLDIPATGFLTSYSYDPVGNLLSVSQNGLNPRTYTYDHISRLTSEQNPESGTATYTYFGSGANAGDLQQRVSPKPNQTGALTLTTTYGYDALHRLTSVTYSDSTPQVTYGYDQTSAFGVSLSNAKGRISSEKTSVSGVTQSGAIFSYDAVGRILGNSQYSGLGVTLRSIAYTYDYLGNTLTASDGVGHTFTSSYDTATGLVSVSSNLVDSQHPATLISGITYSPFGSFVSATLGNGVTMTRGYNNMGRFAWIADGSLYTINSSSNPISYTPNGSILAVNDSVNGSWTYGYDEFNRISVSSGTTGLGTNAFAYDYDQFGNRWNQRVTSGSGPAPTYTFDANNRITTSAVQYDAAGNVLNDGIGHSYTYDAEGRVTSVNAGSIATYYYDGEGRRIRTITSAGTYDWLFDLSGRIITGVSSAGLWSNGEVYAAGRHLATYTTSNTTYFSHVDWLGTERKRSSASGTGVESFTSLPFGDSLSSQGSSAVHFTGQLHDSETNVDSFWFRNYSAIQGRWLRSDPAGLSATSVLTPQSWNRYAYVMNDPASNTDPLGLWCGAAAGPNGWDTPCNPSNSGGGGGGGSFANYDPWGLMNIPVTTKTWGWIPVTPNTTNFAGPTPPNGNVTTLTYWGLGTTVVGNGLIFSGADVPVGMDIWHNSKQCPDCQATWRKASNTANTALVATGVVVVGVPLAGEVGTSKVGELLFSRGSGLLNTNNYLRIGWGWYGGNIIDFLPVGGEVFRVVVGNPNSPVHWHLWPF